MKWFAKCLLLGAASGVLFSGCNKVEEEPDPVDYVPEIPLDFDDEESDDEESDDEESDGGNSEDAAKGNADDREGEADESK